MKWWEQNRIVNDKMRYLAAKHAFVPLSRDELEKLLFYATVCGAANAQACFDEIPEFDDWDEDEFMFSETPDKKP